MPFTKSSKKGLAGRDNSPEPGPSKGDKYTSDDDDEPVPRKGKSYQSSKNKLGKMSKKSPNIVNKQSGSNSNHNKTAELFRKDLISAMKMADTEILYDGDYVVISDPWRQEWEKGVQVPVNEDEILPVEIREVQKKAKHGDFKLPPRKYLHEKIDETYQAGQHELTNMQELADAIVRYDLDDQDVTWLQLVNDDREEMGLQGINEWNMERMIEELENQCYIKSNALKKTEEGLGIEYDEDVACDVCRMLESEDTNEMVFCDGCDICVHQACYGIQTIPEGSWLCRICALGIKPMCLLCPKRGGAMKSTKSGTKWTHVSCALWIPEVSIGCPEKMEPITKISNIPPSRWALVCCLCKERVGACIQCSVKQCKTAFHVTCGFAHNLDMKTIVDDSDEADGIHLRAYCPKHTKNRNASDSESPKKEDFMDNENDISEAEMAKKRSEKLKQLEEEFYTLVDTQEMSKKFFIPEEAVDIVAEYWKVKRKVNNNKPLITPKMEEEDQMQKQQQDSLSARMKMFVHLRQDLERARNLCYMISKREKNKRQLFKMKESVFRAQIRVLTDPDLSLSAREAEKVRQEYYFDSIYSDYGVASSRSSKQPRENLFTLENLKTPKDFDDSDDESVKKGGKVADKHLKLEKGKVKEDNDMITCDDSPTNSTSFSEKSEGHHRDSFFSVDGFRILDDSTVESSEDESLATLAKSTNSSQVSRLGKVKLTEIEEKGADGEPGDIKAIPESPTKKFVPSSDLRKKLTSILQSKNMMHQRHEKVQSAISEPVTEVLHVDVENSDSEVFTSDTNTDLMSPTDQPRNLFDQFRVRGKSMLSSPDIPPLRDTTRSALHLQRKKIKTKRHNHFSHKQKKSRLILSPDQSSVSSIAAKPESAVSGDTDSVSFEQTSQIMSDDTDMSSSSPNVPIDLPESDYQNHSPLLNSLQQSEKGKSGKLHEDLTVSDSPGKSLRSLARTLPQISPSPRVNPNDIYATMDGDIYVPSGKIQVTERTIVLDDPLEEDKRPKSKLRLKKQANSPVKGVISYEVVKDEDDRHDIFGDKKQKIDTDEKRNIFESVMDTTSSRLEFSSKPKVEVSSSRHRSLRRHAKLEDSSSRIQDKKFSESDTLHLDTDMKKEESIDQDSGSDRKSLSSDSRLQRKRRRSKALLTTTIISQNDLKKEILSDENFKPKDVSLEESGKKSQERTVSESVSVFVDTEVKKEVVEEKKKAEEKSRGARKDLFNINLRQKRSKSKTPLAATVVLENDEKKGDSADENFKPKVEQSKPHTPVTRRSHTARTVQETDGNHGFKELLDSPPTRRKCTYNRAISNHLEKGVVLKPLPGKPGLAALHDSRQLIVKEDLKKRVAAKLDKIIKGRRRWGSSNGIRGSSQPTIDRFVTRNVAHENVFSKPDIVNDPSAKHLLLPLAKSDLSPLQVNKSSSMNSQGDPSDRPNSVSASFRKTAARDSVFGAHSSSRHILSTQNTPRKCDSSLGSQVTTPKKPNENVDKNSDRDMLFGDVDKLRSPGLKEQLSFKDVSRSADLAEVVKTPSKCDPAGLSEDRLDGHRSYRSQSPPSSEGSGASSRLLQLDSRESTPSRRVTRSHFVEDIHSPSTRSKTRESLLKAPQLKLS